MLLSSTANSAIPCLRFNNEKCNNETCSFSHSPDSFSLSSGGPNVCLLFLTDRCIGDTCRYSHRLEHLDWTPDEVQMAVKDHLLVIDMYLQGLQRFESSAAPGVPLVQASMNTSQHVAPPLPGSVEEVWPTPPGSNSHEDECGTGANNLELGDTEEANHDYLMSTVAHSDSSRPTPPVQTLNPRAPSFVPSFVVGQGEIPSEKAPEQALNPYSSGYAHGYIPVTSPETEEEHLEGTTHPDHQGYTETPENAPVEELRADDQADTVQHGATEADINGWVPRGPSNVGWDDPPIASIATGDGTQEPWRMNFHGQWDANPPVDAWQNPAAISGSAEPQAPTMHTQPDKKGKKYDRQSRNSQSKLQSKAKTQLPPSNRTNAKTQHLGFRKARKDRTSLQKSLPSSPFSTVHTETPPPPVEKPPHLTEEKMDLNLYRKYQLPDIPGCVKPSVEKELEIIAANAAASRANSSSNTPKHSPGGFGHDLSTVW